MREKTKEMFEKAGKKVESFVGEHKVECIVTGLAGIAGTLIYLKGRDDGFAASCRVICESLDKVANAGRLNLTSVDANGNKIRQNAAAWLTEIIIDSKKH